MSDEKNNSRIRNALDRSAYSNSSGAFLEFQLNEDKLREDYRYRLEGKAYPRNINSFNWGACIFPPVWGIFNNTPIACLSLLFSFIPFVGLILSLIFSVYCGANGNEWAWKNKQWRDLNHFHDVQRKWAIWSFSIEFVIIFIAVSVLFGVLNLGIEKYMIL